MKYTIKRTGKFKKNFKLAQKRGLDSSLLKEIILKLRDGIPLEAKYKDHALKGKWDGFRGRIRICCVNDKLDNNTI